MTNYPELSQKPGRFLALTGFTLEEFQAFLPNFKIKFHEHMENFTFEGKKRSKRKYIEYNNSSLPTIENKLLFILIYFKTNCLQEVLAEMFKLPQPKTNRWIHLLHTVLNQTLEQINLLPARDAETLQKRLARKAEALVNLGFDASGLVKEASDLSNAFGLGEEPTSIWVPKPEAGLGAQPKAGLGPQPEAGLGPQPKAGLGPQPKAGLGPQPEAGLGPQPEAGLGPQPEAGLGAQPEAGLGVQPEAGLGAQPEAGLGFEVSNFHSNDSDLSEEQALIFWHDGTERPINRPLDNEVQQNFFSGKQKQHTLKNNQMIDSSCQVIFLSKTTFGSKHDKKLADEAGYRLPSGSILYQDTGFQGFYLPSVTIIQPKKKPRGQELTSSEKKKNRAISSIRVRIEHVIGSVKRYRIVKDIVRNWKKGFKDKVLETCCGLHNFRLGFRPWCYETVPN